MSVPLKKNFKIKVLLIYTLMKVSHEKSLWLLHSPVLSSSLCTPLHSLSISVVRCHRGTTCLLCSTLSSPWSPTSCVPIIIPLNPLLPPSSPALPQPPLWLTASPFLESVSLLLFRSFSFTLLLYSTNEGNHLVFGFLHLAYFTEHNIFQLHPCYCKW